jgi:hypothetical protein
MKLSAIIRTSGLGFAVLCLSAQTPDPDQQTGNVPKTATVNEAPGIPPRAAPSDYQAQAKAGEMTIAAEFAGHAIPAVEGSLSTEDYLVVETAFFGSPGARPRLSYSDFALRINGKKTPLPAEPYERVGASAKDPEWTPPVKAEKSKGSILGGGGGSGEESKLPPKVPPEVQRAIAQKVKKASLAEGERPLPRAGLVYFRYPGKIQGIRSAELVYTGPAGATTLDLLP